MNEREYRLMYAVETSHWWYVALHKLIVETVEKEARGSQPLRLLDAGCGTGRLCQLLQRFGRVSGCDLSVTALDLCQERGIGSIFQADLNSMLLPEKEYDVITSIDVLYHQAIKDDSAVVKKFFAALRPGGVLILNLVAHEFLRSPHDIAVHTRKRYSRLEVVTMLEENGFIVEQATCRLCLFFLPIACYRLYRRLVSRGRDAAAVASDVRPPPKILNSLLLFLANCDNLLLKRCSPPFGTSVFAVARRPG